MKKNRQSKSLQGNAVNEEGYPWPTKYKTKFWRICRPFLVSKLLLLVASSLIVYGFIGDSYSFFYLPDGTEVGWFVLFAVAAFFYPVFFAYLIWGFVLDYIHTCHLRIDKLGEVIELLQKDAHKSENFEFFLKHSWPSGAHLISENIVAMNEKLAKNLPIGFGTGFYRTCNSFVDNFSMTWLGIVLFYGGFYLVYELMFNGRCHYLSLAIILLTIISIVIEEVFWNVERATKQFYQVVAH